MNKRIKTLVLSLVLIGASTVTVVADMNNYTVGARDNAFLLDYMKNPEDAEIVKGDLASADKKLILTCDIEDKFFGSEILINSKQSKNIGYYEIYGSDGYAISEVERLGEKVAVFPGVSYGDVVIIKLFDLNKEEINTIVAMLDKEIIFIHIDEKGDAKLTDVSEDGSKLITDSNEKTSSSNKSKNNNTINNGKIKSIKDIKDYTYLYSDYKLPTQIDAKMDNGKSQKVNVTWDKNQIDTTNLGQYVIKGQVKGYKNKVKYTITIEPIRKRQPSYKLYTEQNYASDKQTYIEIAPDVTDLEKIVVLVNGKELSYRDFVSKDNNEEFFWTILDGNLDEKDLKIKFYTKEKYEKMRDGIIWETEDVTLLVNKGEKVNFPQTVNGILSGEENKKTKIPVKWNIDKKVDTSKAGSYEFHGVSECTFVDGIVKKTYETKLNVVVIDNNNPLIAVPTHDFGYYESTTGVSYNSIGTPEANIIFCNTSSKTIDAFECIIYCYDSFDEPAKHYLYNTNKFKGIAQNKKIESGDVTTPTWVLYGYDLTTKIKNIQVTRVHFTDGTTWKR